MSEGLTKEATRSQGSSSLPLSSSPIRSAACRAKESSRPRAPTAEDPLASAVYHDRHITLNFAGPILDERGRIVRVWSNRISIERLLGEVGATLREDLKAVGAHTVKVQVVNRAAHAEKCAAEAGERAARRAALALAAE